MAVPGVRVRHPVQRNVRFNITEPSVQYSTPRECSPPEFGGCGQIHTHKTHHLNLDDTGTVIVERVLLEKIRPYLLAFGFSIEDEIKTPPAMGIGLGPRVNGTGQWGNIPIVEGKERR